MDIRRRHEGTVRGHYFCLIGIWWPGFRKKNQQEKICSYPEMCSQAPTPTLPTLTVAENTPLLALGHLRPNRTLLTQNVKDKIEINSALWRRAFYYYHDLEKKETRLYEPGMIANPTSLKGTWVWPKWNPFTKRNRKYSILNLLSWTPN